MYIPTKEMSKNEKDFLLKKFNELLERNSSMCMTWNKDKYGEVIMQLEFRYFQPEGMRGKM
ncbi:hypothetical protein MOF23_07660 [Bacillus inaquosorum]|uniref:hypothetical protein n=1 Tax=Bacillus inaquosorum TaxID=483913 RepID=UPI00227DB11F|nr:hypothetical protein [Bacillus inaquosorum]MCY9308845.1 hypothetical protein [Bacillus inaquosorum]